MQHWLELTHVLFDGVIWMILSNFKWQQNFQPDNLSNIVLQYTDVGYLA